MAAPWVTAFGNATNGFIAVWDRLVNLGDNWYKQNGDWETRKQKMKDLRKKLEMWKKEASDRGLSSHADLTECLDDARKVLEEEEEVLRKNEANPKLRKCNKAKRTLFPSLVEDSLKRVEYVCDNFERLLKEREKAREVLDKEVNRGVLSVSMRDVDSRYVRFEETENSIWEALLDNSGRPRVVLLEGGGGTGKSTVARYIKTRFNPKKDSTFAYVHFLDCGSEASIHLTKLLHKLIQCLGEKPADEYEAKETSSSVPLQKQFKGLLSARQMLLVLDGLTLRDEDFLLKMVQMGFRGLKILITGQAEVCRSLLLNYDYVSIRIQTIDKELATKILAAHAGFRNHEIPPNLVTSADELIAKTDHNPLALATLGGAIDRDRLHREEEWANLSRNTSRALKTNQAPDAPFLGKSRSLRSTLEQNIKNLSEGARNLLSLRYASSVNSVPEIIVQLLYNRVQGDGVFSHFRNELENHQLIRCHLYEFCNNHPIKLWDKLSLPEDYIEGDEGMRAARDSVLDPLIGAGTAADQPEDVILLGLIEEFFEGDLAVKAIAKRRSVQSLSSDVEDGGGLPLEIELHMEDLLELVGFYPSCHRIFVPYFYKRDKLADLVYNVLQ